MMRGGVVCVVFGLGRDIEDHFEIEGCLCSKVAGFQIIQLKLVSAFLAKS